MPIIITHTACPAKISTAPLSGRNFARRTELAALTWRLFELRLVNRREFWSELTHCTYADVGAKISVRLTNHSSNSTPPTVGEKYRVKPTRQPLAYVRVNCATRTVLSHARPEEKILIVHNARPLFAQEKIRTTRQNSSKHYSSSPMYACISKQPSQHQWDKGHNTVTPHKLPTVKLDKSAEN